MKEKIRINEDAQVRDFLNGYKNEDISPEFKGKVIDNVLSAKSRALIKEITPGWKRLSLAASIAAFAVGVVMSNLVFDSSQNSTSDTWTVEDQGLYSYMVEVDQ